MIVRIAGVAAVAALLAAGCQQAPSTPDVSALSEDDKSIYAFGVLLGQQLDRQIDPLDLTEEELELLQSGLGDALAGRPAAVEPEAYQDRFQALAESRVAANVAASEERAADFLAKAGERDDAVTTDSGLVFRTITPGEGPSPSATDVVRVHYHGTLQDGTVFDSSRDRGEPAEFPLNQVIPCWSEGVQRMQVGEKAELICPAAIAYGAQGAGGVIPPGATLIFEVELLGIGAGEE